MAARPPRSSSAPAKGAPKAPAQSDSVRGALWTRGLQRSLIAALVLAPLLALGIQLARVPEVPPSAVSVVKPRTLGPLIAGSIANPQPTTLEFSLDEINTHLAQVLPPVAKKDGSWAFHTASLRLEPEKATLQTVYRWHGFQLHLHVSYAVSLQGGKLQLRPFSASCGRVVLGMYWIRKAEENILRKLLPSLKKEQVLLNRLETLRVEPGRVLMKVRASTSIGGA
ncbi:MAG: hypothetical protein DVB28_000059 [Verrucomicrobia bacterium]|nr:MAG: hypothetical protein DVB28_000059 [Verrucomicrobiota bacterium]